MLEWSAQGDIAGIVAGTSQDGDAVGVIGGLGSKFIMAGCFESNDLDADQISGINAEEQNDIALIVRAKGGPDAAGPKTMMCFVAFDAILIVKDHSVV